MNATPANISVELVKAVENMPAFPKSAHRILQLTRDAACAPKDLVAVIGNDPVVTVKVLRVVNSAHYNLPKKITSIGHAVVFLGFNTIKNLSLSIAAVSMLPSNPQTRFDGHAYLVHSLSVAGVARQIGLQLQSGDPNDYFIAGLLHDFGKVVIAQGMPEVYKQAVEFSLWHEVSMHAALVSVAGIDHSLVGSMLLESWQFPADLVAAVRAQHSLSDQDGDLAYAVCAANQICKKLGVDFGGSPLEEAIPDCVVQRFGGKLNQVTADTQNLELIVEEARRFANL
jgi:HD-like signal output (HDOD) protein